MIVAVMPPFGAIPFPCFSPLPPASASSFLVAVVSSSGTVSCTVQATCVLRFQREGLFQRPCGILWARAPAGKKKRGVGGGVSVVILQVKLWLISPLMGEITWGV